MDNDNSPDQQPTTQDLWTIPKPDWRRWKSKPQVRLWQAIALLCDLAPESLESTFPPGTLDKIFNQRPQPFDNLVALAKSNLRSDGLLKPISLNIESTEESEIALSTVAAWAKSFGIAIPNDFPDNATKKNQSLEEKPLGERERTTLLTLIAALAQEAHIDIKMTSKAAGLIETLTSGMGARIAARTIEDHLKRIPVALEKRGQ